jgi:quinol monooxygenase YgiN
MPFVVIAKFTAKSGMEDRLKAVLEALVAPTRLEAGCLHYELVQAQHDPRQFTFFEKWEDLEALTAHAQTTHVQRARKDRTDFLDGPTDVTRWDVVA